MQLPPRSNSIYVGVGCYPNTANAILTIALFQPILRDLHKQTDTKGFTMRKIIIGSSLTVVALLLIAPLWTGYHSEQELLKLTDSAPLPQGAKVRIDSYDRGWFTSTGELKIIINSEDPAPITLQAPFKVFHGPIIIGKNVGFKIAPAALDVTFAMPQVDEATQKQLADVLDESALLSVIATIGLTGNIHAKINTTGINYEQPESSMSWSGLQGTIDYAPGSKEVASDLTISPLQFTAKTPGAENASDEKSVQLSDVLIKSDLQEVDNGLWIGDVTTDIKTIQHSNGTRITTLEDFHHNSSLENNEDNVTLNYHSLLTLQKATMGEHVIGPVDVDYTVNKLDPQGLMDFNNDLRSVLFSNDSSIAANSIRLLQSTAVMLRHGLQVEVDKFNMKAAKGEFDLTAQFSFPAVTNLMSVLSQANQLLKQINVAINVKVDDALAKQLMQIAAYNSLQQVTQITANATPEEKQTVQDLIAKDNDAALAEWLSKGYIRLEDNRYITEFEIKNGIAFANGKRIEDATITDENAPTVEIPAAPVEPGSITQ